MHIYICIHVCMYVYVYMCIYIYMYNYLCMYICYIYIYCFVCYNAACHVSSQNSSSTSDLRLWPSGLSGMWGMKSIASSAKHGRKSRVVQADDTGRCPQKHLDSAPAGQTAKWLECYFSPQSIATLHCLHMPKKTVKRTHFPSKAALHDAACAFTPKHPWTRIAREKIAQP
jgi:hypothetical protein